jgi:hypothetical protein
VREFPERFHDKNLELLRPKREAQKSFIFLSSQPVAALQQVQSGLVRRIARLYDKAGQAQRIATMDQDATIIESHNGAAYGHYEEGRGYQPMVAMWAEADLVLADEFRDGNVPAKQDPLTCAKLAFAALPETVTQRYFRSDSAWFKIALLTYNVVSAIKGLCLEGEERTARMKRFRLLLIHVAGRMNRNNCVMGLRVCNNAAALKRMQAVWRVFELPTQATS